MDEIWGMDSQTSDVTINVHINRLRKRCEGFTEFEIAAIRGIGYKHASSGNGLGLTIAKKLLSCTAEVYV